MTQASPANDPYADRSPTYHERLTGRPWDHSYHDGLAPWDAGRPQPAVIRLAAQGAFAGRVLDVGCGTAENSLHLASLGLTVVGVDVAPTALAAARDRAAERGLDATFRIADALQLDRLNESFDSVLDCGLFHTFDDDERQSCVVSLAATTAIGGTLRLLCFSDATPAGGGPRRVSQEELRAAFGPGSGWRVLTIDADRYQTRDDADGSAAWLMAGKRV